MSFSFDRKHIAEIFRNAGDFSKAAKVADAWLNFPRPSIEQHLSSDKAARKYLIAHGKAIGYGLLCAASIAMLYAAFQILELPVKSYGTLALALLAAGAVAAAAGDYERAWSPYWKFRRRESQGSAHWATVTDLKARDMLFPRDVKVTPTHLPLAYFGRKHLIALPVEMTREHKGVFGPPGCGKSASFFIHEARDYSDIGAGIFLDTKGEIYKYSAGYYDNVYRIDFERPEYSDRIDLLSFCRPNPDYPGEDAKLAGEIASFMVGFDPNNPKGGENPFWPLSATSMLKCFLLFLAERFEHVQPADIFKVLAVLAKQAEAEAKRNPKNPPPHPLHRAFMGAHNQEIRAEWAPLATLDEKTLGNIIISMTTPIASFRDPSVQTVLSAPSNEERARGCRVIDFRDLRRKGTAIYVVVPEGQAARLASVLGTIFGVAMNVLRRTGDAPNSCDALIQLDEAGNVPLRNLREDIGVGRGRRMTFSLGYQSKNQPKTQFGGDYAEAMLQSIGCKIALPGMTGESAEWFSKMLGKTTTFKHTVNDARADALDSDRYDEVARDLMEPDAFRQLERHKQCVIVVNQAPPILARIPDNAKAVDPTEFHPQKFVWTEEDIRQSKKDEIARQKFYDHVSRMPRLPRTAYEMPHDITLSPTTAYDPAIETWTTSDVLAQSRKREIESYALQLNAAPMSGDEIASTRSRVALLTDAFAQAPDEVERVDPRFAEAVRPESFGGEAAHAGNGGAQTPRTACAPPAESDAAGEARAGDLVIAPASAPPAPVVEHTQAATGRPTVRTFRTVTPERIAAAIAPPREVGAQTFRADDDGAQAFDGNACESDLPSDLPTEGDGYHRDVPH